MNNTLGVVSAIPRYATYFAKNVVKHQFFVKRGRFFSKIRYTERHWADYQVPADSFTYLSMQSPIHNRQLKNTAGMERSANALIAYKHGNYQGRLNISDSYQRSGFFSVAHGVLFQLCKYALRNFV